MRTTLLSTALCVLIANSPAVNAGNHSVDETAIHPLLDLIEGKFNNNKQVDLQIKEGVKKTYDRMHQYRTRISSKQLPGNWIFTQTDKSDQPNSSYRQVIMEFFIGENGDIVSRAWKFSDPAMKARGLPSITFLNTLSRQQLKPALPKQCLSHWVKQGEQYIGSIDHTHCLIQSKYVDEKRQLFAEEIIFSDSLWMREGAYRSDGTLVFGLEAGHYYRYQRVRSD
jgi:hypothetical protein